VLIEVTLLETTPFELMLVEQLIATTSTWKKNE
jgi:hypothetical protein